MVVQHNITAQNSNRLLGITTSSQAKSTEKLSSGYKINRAADDAAGLSISEKMRRQIRGLTQASANAQDGISAVQTAEGALTEVHDMLQRMDELATKAGFLTGFDADFLEILRPTKVVTALNTVTDSFPGGWGYENSLENDGDLRSVIFSHPGAILFSGHTHAYPDVVQRSRGANLFVGTGSVAYAYEQGETYLTDDGSYDSYGWLVRHHEGALEFCMRDFLSHQWVSGSHYIYQLGQ